MDVVFVQSTSWGGYSFKPGDICTVKDETAQRWIRNGIAKALHEAKNSAPVAVTEAEPIAEPVPKPKSTRKTKSSGGV